MDVETSAERRARKEKARLAKLRVTPGIQEIKVSYAEQDMNISNRKWEEAKEREVIVRDDPDERPLPHAHAQRHLEGVRRAGGPQRRLVLEPHRVVPTCLLLTASVHPRQEEFRPGGLMDYYSANAPKKIRAVVNLSLGVDGRSEILDEAVGVLADIGYVVVIAAGDNSGMFKNHTSL